MKKVIIFIMVIICLVVFIYNTEFNYERTIQGNGYTKTISVSWTREGQ